MPFIQVVSRDLLRKEQKEELATALSSAMLEIEIGGPTDAALTRDWVWFQHLPEVDWAVGGKFDDTYIRGRSMCFARIIAPEGFLNKELKLRAIAEVTKHIRRCLDVAPDEDGTGIWVHLVEVPDGQWGAAGTPDSVFQLIDGMGGDVSKERRKEMQAHFKGIEKMKSSFGIPK